MVCWKEYHISSTKIECIKHEYNEFSAFWNFFWAISYHNRVQFAGKCNCETQIKIVYCEILHLKINLLKVYIVKWRSFKIVRLNLDLSINRKNPYDELKKFDLFCWFAYMACYINNQHFKPKVHYELYVLYCVSKKCTLILDLLFPSP